MTLHEKKQEKRSGRKLLMKTLNQVALQNLGKALVSLFFMALCQTFCFSLLVTPLSLGLFRRGLSPAALQLASLVLLFLLFALWALFQYGFFVLLLRMVRREYVTLGFIFYGFKRLKKALPVALVYALVLLALSGAFLFVLLSFTSFPDQLADLLRSVAGSAQALPDAASAAGDPAAAPAAGRAAGASLPFDWRSPACFGGFALLLVFSLLQLAFLIPAMHDEPASSLASALRTNRRLLRKRRLLLLGLMLRSGGRFLLIALLALVLQAGLTTFASPDRHGLAKLLLNFIYLINGYTAILRMYFALPVLYEDARRPRIDLLIEDHSDNAVISGTIALLEQGTPASDTAEVADSGKGSQGGAEER